MGQEVDMQGHASLPLRNGIAFRLGRWLQDGVALGPARLLRWHDLAHQRRALLSLDERMLKDIGITRADAVREARRAFWRDTIDPSSDRGR